VDYLNTNHSTRVRWDRGRFMLWETDIYDTVRSYFLYKVGKLPATATYTVIEEDGRPELLAHNIYGTTQLWWLLMYYNGLIRPSDIVAGLKISYPSLRDLEDLYLSLPAKQSALGV